MNDNVSGFGAVFIENDYFNYLFRRCDESHRRKAKGLLDEMIVTSKVKNGK
jgi:hypothetical protein